MKSAPALRRDTNDCEQVHCSAISRKSPRSFANFIMPPKRVDHQRSPAKKDLTKVAMPTTPSKKATSLRDLPTLRDPARRTGFKFQTRDPATKKRKFPHFSAILRLTGEFQLWLLIRMWHPSRLIKLKHTWFKPRVIP